MHNLCPHFDILISKKSMMCSIFKISNIRIFILNDNYSWLHLLSSNILNSKSLIQLSTCVLTSLGYLSCQSVLPHLVFSIFVYFCAKHFTFVGAGPWEGLKIQRGGGSINVVGIIFPLIELMYMPKSGGGRGPGPNGPEVYCTFANKLSSNIW